MVNRQQMRRAYFRREAAITRDARHCTTVRLSLVDQSRSNPAMDATAFPSLPSEPTFWSASPHVVLTTTAWTVAFDDGSITQYATNIVLSVRCVR